MTEVFVGVGSNIDPRRHVELAVAELTECFGTLECSSVFRSPPFGFLGNDFLNLVVRFESRLSPGAIEETLTRIESAGGRRSTGRGGSRTLDLDLLLVGQRVDARERLPRDDVLRYPFVLAPLAELAPRLRHPVTGISIAEAWNAMAATAGRLERDGVVGAP
jgi:2-amino-4-hydroxy-6-hydroxymethyldihydropteridine diphosphokinase